MRSFKQDVGISTYHSLVSLALAIAMGVSREESSGYFLILRIRQHASFPRDVSPINGHLRGPGGYAGALECTDIAHPAKTRAENRAIPVNDISWNWYIIPNNIEREWSKRSRRVVVFKFVVVRNEGE